MSQGLVTQRELRVHAKSLQQPDLARTATRYLSLDSSISSRTMDSPKEPIASTNADAAAQEPLLSYPTPSFEPIEAPQASTSQQPRQVLRDRLYIGNLHPSVDEYALLQVFSKFGKVTKLDFLFHKTGLMKGKPRGYAFVEYGTNEEAQKALSKAHDKLLRGRKLVVTFAQQAPTDQSGAAGFGGRSRRGMMDVGKPTTLSMLKTGMGTKRSGTDDKIAMMEAKLRQMEASKAEATTSRSSLPSHHSLPPKPPPVMPALAGTQAPTAQPQRVKRPAKPLPSLPILPRNPSADGPPTVHASTALLSVPRQEKKPSLVGVKIGRPKDRAS
ncbi:hypothetical protein HGRIS_014229 [Hohenbuehelia grisea]|uniref:Probable RNA-binding protein 18 n=1 Tax=Hohenbuehelia grisea TaxID=104357 RepID=A0ABR3JTR0_9AGAR